MENKQISFGEMEFASKRKKTRKEIFFAKMEKIIPLKEWCRIIEPYYYERGNGRPPIRIEIILKMYLVSQWFNLSDEECEDMLNENLAARKYVGITGDAPDATTLCKFRGILDKNGLTEKIFASFIARLEAEHVIMHEGTIVDATIIEAPTSKKNKSHQRTPEMGATQKRNQSHYGSKAHIGIDKDSKIVHSIAVTPANVSDIAMSGELVHGQETEIYGDSGYVGMEKIAMVCEKFQDGSGKTEWVKRDGRKPRFLVCKTKDGVKFNINKKRSKVIDEYDRERERQKSKIRVKVEHIFAIIKERFKCRKILYRTLNKVKTKLVMLFTLANVLTYSRMKLCTK